MTAIVYPASPAAVMERLVSPCCGDLFEPVMGMIDGNWVVRPGLTCENCGATWNEYGEPVMAVR